MRDGGQHEKRGAGDGVKEYERRPGESLMTAIPSAVGSFLSRDPTDLNPLFEAIDPESLDELFGEAQMADVHIQFLYEGCTIGVTSHRIRVERTHPE